MLKLKRSIFVSCLLFSQISCYSLNTNFSIDMNRVPANDGPVGSLSGRVLDAKNRPIVGATITVSEEGRIVSAASTDQFGLYRVDDLRSRDYAVNASADGFRSDTYMVRVIEGEDIEYTFILPDV